MDAVIEGRAAIIDAARALAPQFATRAGEGDTLRTMPPDLVAAAKAAGLFRLALPRMLGGLELDPAAIAEVIETLSYADGSAGWTIMIGNSTLCFAWLDPQVASSLIGDCPDVVSTSMFAPKGHAVADGCGGFVVDGRWPFNSGCPHADWYQVGVRVMDGEQPRVLPDGRPDLRFAFFPRTGGQVIETWDALGLRGTGSHDLLVEGLRVPEEHTAAPLSEPARHDGPLWRLPFRALLETFMGGFVLGVASRALDEFAELAGTKTRGTAPGTLAHDPHVQVELGRAEAGLLAGRALLTAVRDELWATARTDSGQLSPELAARHSLALLEAMRAGLAAVDITFALTGADAVYDTHPLQRCFRDLHTANQHMAFAPEGFMRYARLRLGIDG